MSTFALFLPNWIGDVVMATPAIRALKQEHPHSRMIAVCRPYVADVVEGSPWFDDVLLHDKKGPASQRGWHVIRQLRKERIDTAILFPNSFRSAWLARLGGCRRRIGFARYGRSFLLTDRLQPIRDPSGKLKPSPIINDYNRLVQVLGITPSYRQELFTTVADETQADEVWQNLYLHLANEVIALNPGAAFGAAKHWPIEHFATLARMLVEQRGCHVLVLCGPNEREMARQICQQANKPGVVSLADQPISIGLSKAMIRRVNLLITTDSGPRHFAAAFDRPVITLFGPTFIDWTETYFPKAIHLQKQVPCGPCQQRICPLDHRCMKDLRPQDVFRSIEDLLQRFPGEWRKRDVG